MYCLAAREDQTAQQRSEYSANILSLERLLPQPLLLRGMVTGLGTHAQRYYEVTVVRRACGNTGIAAAVRRARGSVLQ